jgi:RNA:NAD 2'-phosphotransferase (TPT1/KptA family)
MHGNIVSYHADLGQGVIATPDGRRFRFNFSEIRNPNGNPVGADVDFLVESRRPKDIILLHGSIWTVFQSRREEGILSCQPGARR